MITNKKADSEFLDEELEVMVHPDEWQPSDYEIDIECPYCHSRKEVSKEYYKGYLQGSIDRAKSNMNELAEMKDRINKAIERTTEYIKFNMDEALTLLSEEEK